MIKIKNLKVKVLDKQILNGVSLDFEVGKNYLLLGRNGSGKSSLSSFLMGNPVYEYESGEVSLEGNDLLELSPEERSKSGLFLSFQNVPEIAGIKLSEYLRTIYNISVTKPPLIPPFKGGEQEKSPLLSEEGQGGGFKGVSPFIFKRFIKKHLTELNIPEKFLDRDLNVGFSGGEKRKIEILQMKLIGPKYIILDEIDSGLDLDAFKTIANLLKELSSENNTIIIITHHFKILEYLNVDKIYVMKDGNIAREGGLELADEIIKNGFEKL
ncbi:MAG: ABC transporter ATP-binding protein [Candidatus Gracilibacteria bacterium]|nr:ABC transporter ATP-binding protein [Candidatus Gracilibacteria bacterium]